MNKTRTPLAQRPVVRVLIIWVLQTAGLIIMTLLMDSVHVDNVVTAFIVTAVIGLLNALLWPLLSYIIVPFAVLTLGLAALLLNGFMVYFASQLVDGFEVTNFWSAFWLSIGMTAINIIFSTLLTLDDDNSWSRNQVKRRMKRIAKPEPTDVPGILFLEIDGLAEPVLEKAMAEGHIPTITRWVKNGSHEVTGWETDTSSQTSASQAGILHGNNSNIPAFRWFDKEKQEIVASSNTKVLPHLEAERSDGNGLLSDNGASRGNLLSGDAPFVMATASSITDRSKFHASEFQAYFATPYNVARTFLLFFWDVILEWWQFRQARKNNVQPILDKSHRGGIYPFIRAAMTVFMRELNIYTLLGDMFAGRPSAYATFVGYDEVAHHSGVLDPGAFDVLRKLDQQFARLESAAKEAPRPYHLVVLSDHGQTGGATFKQRYGKSLEEFVQELMADDTTIEGILNTDEGSGNLSVFLTDTIRNETSGASSVVRRALKKQTVDGEVILSQAARESRENEIIDEPGEKLPEIYALASGNLGLISFTAWPERLTLEELMESYPLVVPGLASHEGVGFVMVRGKEQGTQVIGANGRYFLDNDTFDGENPLEGFGPNVADHLRRTDSFPNCPDILVNSFYDPETGEGCAFEELIGFHGGLGGYQTQPFILHPVELKAGDNLVGAASIYRLGKGWLEELHGPNEIDEKVLEEMGADEEE